MRGHLARRPTTPARPPRAARPGTARHERARTGGPRQDGPAIRGATQIETGRRIRCAPAQPATRINAAVAHQARVYDYLPGGKDNFATDREAPE
ncbi:SAM-dependent methyltransferase [Microbispora sp. CA-135349]|uniref:SAM-dependent methyltransferase n=1 Tax=Microbispora sp. CA-135349 TaxID=3239953 RepID=UPI003D8C361C